MHRLFNHLAPFQIRIIAGMQDTMTYYFRVFVEFFGKQLDPEYTYEPNFSPKNYFAQYSIQDYLRIVIYVGAYALIIRPLFEKTMRKLRDASNEGKGPQPIAIELPAWQTKDEKKEEDGLDWGAKIRRRAREAQAEKDASAADNEMEDSELDKYLD